MRGIVVRSLDSHVVKSSVNRCPLSNGTEIRFDRDPRMQIYGYSIGLKSGATLNYRINRGTSLKLGVHYRLYTPIEDWYIVIEESTGDSVDGSI